MPVNPIVTGTPGAGFRVDRVSVDPLVVSVEGDQDQLVVARVARTRRRSPCPGRRATSRARCAFALPTGVSVIGGPGTARVTVHIVPVTETRNFTAGLRLDGRRPTLEYEVVRRAWCC